MITIKSAPSCNTSFDVSANELAELIDNYAKHCFLPMLDDDTDVRSAELMGDPAYAYDEQAYDEAMNAHHRERATLDREVNDHLTVYQEVANQIRETGALPENPVALGIVQEIVDQIDWPNRLRNSHR